MGTGMLVTHVDYNAAAWSNNTVNTDPTRLRYTYIPADNAKQDEFAPSSDFRGDLYPGTSGNRALSDESSPAALSTRAATWDNRFTTSRRQTEW